MTESKQQTFFEKATTGFSCHKAEAGSESQIMDLSFLSVNHAFEKLTGVRSSDVVGKSFQDIFSRSNGYILSELSDHTDILMHRIPSGADKKKKEQWIRVRSFLIDDALHGAVYTDVTREQTNIRRLNGVLNVSTDILVVFDDSFRILDIKESFTRAFGYEKEDVEGTSLLTMMNIDDVPEAMGIAKTIAEKRIIYGFRCMIHCKTGVFRSTEWRFCYDDSRVYASCREVVDGDEDANSHRDDKDLHARTDERTGLYNRDFFFRSATTEMDRTALYNEKISLLIIEFEHLKTVGDSWGHPVSDDIMRQAAQIIGHTLRKADVAVHFGGDEIVILLPQTSAVGSTAAADKLRRILAENIRTKTGKVSASYGIAEREQDEPLGLWYKRADAALHAAKNRGHNCISAAEANALALAPDARYSWKESFESGDPEIDSQHRELMYTGRELIDMSLANVEYNELIKLVDRLIGQVTQHFAYEEQLLMKIKYPQYRQHAKIHQKLLGKMNFLRDSYKKQQIKSPAFFLLLTKDLVHSHLEDEDTRFFDHIRQAKGDVSTFR